MARAKAPKRYVCLDFKGKILFMRKERWRDRAGTLMTISGEDQGPGGIGRAFGYLFKDGRVVSRKVIVGRVEDLIEIKE